jgi:hypothetical protein
MATKNFTDAEIVGLQEELVKMLQQVRDHAVVPIHITSGYRPGDTKSHGEGAAVDISDNKFGKPVASRWRFLILKAAFAVGFRRIGVYDRHIHLDINHDSPGGQDVVWTGVSE